MAWPPTPLTSESPRKSRRSGLTEAAASFHDATYFNHSSRSSGTQPSSKSERFHSFDHTGAAMSFTTLLSHSLLQVLQASPARKQLCIAMSRQSLGNSFQGCSFACGA